MELLAPAGSRAAFAAALAAGADAVYLGAPGCNARSLSRDFTMREINEMIHRGHEAGCRVYIAMNSLVKEAEIPQVLDVLSRFEQMQPDALIVQDFGLLRICRRFFPSLPLHASTLTSVHNSQVVDWLAGMGCSRVVLARELTIEEIRTIGQSCRADLEIFVQGAMCFSYSGLCLFSSLHGGKSSLRGRCVQPCRRRYSWAGHKGSSAAGYFFSMNDLSGIDLLPALRQAGVVSLKIEGRLKSVEYVHNTVRAYRLILDSLDRPAEERQQAAAEAGQLLAAALGRKSSTGFFLSSRGKGVIDPGISGNTGRLVGRVKGVKPWRRAGGGMGTSLDVVLQTGLHVGDRLRLHVERSGDRVAFTLNGLISRGKSVHQARSGQRVSCLAARDLLLGPRERALLYKVDVRARRTRERNSLDQGKTLLPLPASAARTQAAVLSELGIRARTGAPSRSSGKSRRLGRGAMIPWWVRIRTPDAMRQRLPIRPEKYLLPLNRKNCASHLPRPGKRVVWVLPPVIQEDQVLWFTETVNSLVHAGFRHFQLGHMGQQGLFQDLAPGTRLYLYGDYTFNILNAAALLNCREQGFSAAQFSLETDRRNLEEALAHFRRAVGRDMPSLRVGMYMFGRPPLFTARFKGGHLLNHRPLLSPRKEELVLDQDGGITHARSVRPFSLLAHRRILQEMGIDYFVVDLSGGGFKKEVTALHRCLRDRGRQREVLTGNFTGTLQ